METIITPADLQSAYLDGMWHGGLGVCLIIFGIIGWPATRYVLGVLAYPFTRRSPRTPVGSPYWDKYNAPHRKQKFDFHAISTNGGKR
jgi:hypothetical protein